MMVLLDDAIHTSQPWKENFYWVYCHVWNWNIGRLLEVIVGENYALPDKAFFCP